MDAVLDNSWRNGVHFRLRAELPATGSGWNDTESAAERRARCRWRPHVSLIQPGHPHPAPPPNNSAPRNPLPPTQLLRRVRRPVPDHFTAPESAPSSAEKPAKVFYLFPPKEETRAMPHLPSEQKEDRECARAANFTAASVEEGGRGGAFKWLPVAAGQKGLPDLSKPGNLPQTPILA